MSGTNPVDGGGPVVTPPEQTTRNRLLAAGVLMIIAAAVLVFYLMPRRETGADQQERLAQEREQRDRPGDPGRPLRKPGFEEIPQPQPVVATEKPATPAVPPMQRYRPVVVSSAMWTAPPPPPPPERPATSAAARAVPATAVTPAGETPQAKLAGLPVMQAERIDDASWYLMPGEEIMCRNNQPLTERTGAFWTATIPEEKLSRDGTRVLIPANSQAFGKITTGFNRGDRRLAAVITHIAGPSVPGKPTLFIPIDMGQVGDDLGRVDMDGNIESDFWGRLATVGAYAALDALAHVGSSYATGAINRGLNGDGQNGVNVNVGNFGGMMTGQSLAGMQMQQELQKQPQFNRPQAQPCTIMITKSVDFRKALQIGGR